MGFRFRSNVQAWFLVILIGICIGLLAALLKQCLQLLNNIRWDRAKEFAEVWNQKYKPKQESSTLTITVSVLLQEDDIVMTWTWNTCIGIFYIIISSFLVVVRTQFQQI